MTLEPTDVVDGIVAVLHEIVGVPRERVVPEAMFREDLNIDDLTMIEVVVACEERLGIRLADEVLASLGTVQGAVDSFIAASSCSCGVVGA